MIPKKRKIGNHDWDSIISIALIVCVNVSIILFLIVGNVRLFLKKQDMRAQLVDLNTEVVKLAEKNAELNKMFYEASQQEYAENIMREEGMYKKAGEEVVVILGNEQQEEETAVNAKASFLDTLKDFFNSMFGR